MKHILFILSIIFCCGCSNEMKVDDQAAITRSTAGSTYYFESYSSNPLQPIVALPSKKDSIRRTIVSYKEIGSTTTDIDPEVLNKPTWVNNIIFYNAYYKIYEVFISVDENTSPEKRTGMIVLKQPESNKTLSIGITQNGTINYISISVKNTYKNQYQLIANTEYAVEKEVGVKIPLIVYNDGGELSHNATIDIPKGEKTGSYIMDWNASPLVHYHGDIKGYRLYEGNIYNVDDIYTYTLRRYW